MVSEYLDQIIRSFIYATLATLLALAISYPIAYFIAVKARNKPVLQALLLTLVIAPFFISFLLRTFAWKQVFGQIGVGQPHPPWHALGIDQLAVDSPDHMNRRDAVVAGGADRLRQMATVLDEETRKWSRTSPGSII